MITWEDLSIPTATLGEDSRIPDFAAPDSIPYFICDESITGPERDRIGKRMIASVLPWKMQTGYDRTPVPRTYRAAVLENDCLRAVFLPELGGRLFSLYDKRRGEDVIYENKEIRFGNLALCNAWFAGGVEWNLGIKGHSPLTNRPLFAGRAIGRDGREYLKMYEYEPIRGLVYVMYFTLEEERLLASFAVENVTDRPTDLYWWSNIAVAQKPTTRVLVPTDHSYITSYAEGGYRVSRKPIPDPEGDGSDVSYPAVGPRAIDYFFDIPDGEEKWICSLDTATGRGLLHLSTRELIGRKMFLWGNQNGGRHWNAWLTQEDGSDPYLEIQAGLARTQFEYLTLGAHDTVRWSEVYYPADFPGLPAAYKEAAEKIGRAAKEEIRKIPAFPGEEHFFPVQYGSGRGALAAKLYGRPLTALADFSFGEDRAAYAFYLDLLDGRPAHATEKSEYVNHPELLPLILKNPGNNAQAWLLAAVIAFCSGDHDATGRYLEKAVQAGADDTVLAAAACFETRIRKNHVGALALLAPIAAARSFTRDTARLYAEICLRAGRERELVTAYPTFPEEIRQYGRIRMYLAMAYVALGELEAVPQFLNEELVVPDLREGEYAVSRIYTDYYRLVMEREGIAAPDDGQVLAAHPLPYALDFRMK